MLMLTAFILAALSVVAFGGKLGRLRHLEFRAGYLCALALAVQILVISVLPSGSFSAAGHVGSYVLIAAFLVVNRAVPGLWLIGIGAILNFTAISVNGGVMPASEGALEAAGMSHGVGAEFDNSGHVEDAKLAFLGDVFAIPEPWIFANVFSVGDIGIAVGAAVGMHVTCESRLSRRRRNLALSVGDAAEAHDMADSDANEHLTGDPVTPAELLSPLGAHVAAPDAGCPVPDFFDIVDERGLPFDADEGEWWLLVVEADGHSGISADGPRFTGSFPGGEDDVAVVDVDPYRGHLWLAQLAQHGDLAGPWNFENEPDPVVTDHGGHLASVSGA